MKEMCIRVSGQQIDDVKYLKCQYSLTYNFSSPLSVGVQRAVQTTHASPNTFLTVYIVITNQFLKHNYA